MLIHITTKKKLLIGAVALVGFILLVKLLLFVLPFSKLDTFVERQYSTRFYDRNGELLQILPLEDGLRREWYPLEELPPKLVDVFISAEDKNFYRHSGIDFFAIVRAMLQNIREKKTVSGASTITMQLARLIYPRRKEESLVAVKIREAWLAIRIEGQLSKDRILELYLNSLPFGRQAEGVGSALRTYFGNTPLNASIAQIYALAVIPRRPSLYNPHKNPQLVYKQAQYIKANSTLNLSYDEWLEQVKSPIQNMYPAKAPHFIIYVITEYKKKNEIIPPELHLTIDNENNEYAANLINDKLKYYASSRISNGSVFAIDNKTGEILVWVGNGDFNDTRGGQIDGVLVENQPGSSLKPFLYALALDKNIQPTTIFADVPQEFGAENVYIPMNFDNRYNGPQNMRISLASSLNIPAVSLLYRLGLDEYMQTLLKLGFNSLDGEGLSSGLSLALGSGEVSLYELVRAFSAFPLDGIPADPIFTLSQSIDSPNTKKVAVYSSDTARIISDFLSDTGARSLGFGLYNVFRTEYPSIFKTGTSNQFQDIVALGATPDFTVGSWMGNFSGNTVIGKTGSTIPAEIVRKILDSLVYSRLESNPTIQDFAKPDNYKKEFICALSAMIPTEACTSLLKEFLPIGRAAEKLKTCDWHYFINGKTTVRYPEEYQRWFSAQRNIAGNLNTPHNDYSIGQGTTNLTFISPLNGSVFVYDPSLNSSIQQIRIDCIGGSSNTANLFINDSFVATQNRPYIWYLPILPGTYELKVQEDSGETAKITIDIL